MKGEKKDDRKPARRIPSSYTLVIGDQDVAHGTYAKLRPLFEVLAQAHEICPAFDAPFYIAVGNYVQPDPASPATLIV